MMFFFRDLSLIQVPKAVKNYAYANEREDQD